MFLHRPVEEAKKRVLPMQVSTHSCVSWLYRAMFVRSNVRRSRHPREELIGCPMAYTCGTCIAALLFFAAEASPTSFDASSFHAAHLFGVLWGCNVGGPVEWVVSSMYSSM